MPEIKYLEFDLLIEHAEQGYRARVLNSPAGQAVADFTLPFSDLEIENFLLRMGQTRRGAAMRDVRLAGGQELDVPKVFGGRLYEAVFAGDVQGCLRSSLDETERQNARLRLRLRLAEAPELLDLPWEYLYNPSLNRFYALSVETPLVRYLDLPEPVQSLAVTLPLRVLVLISSPTDYPQLDVAQELAKLNTALASLQERGLIVLEQLADATLAELQQRLRQGKYHILHIIGHGGFDPQAQDGALVLEDQAGRGQLVSGQDLGTLLHDHHSLRLVILNACESARTARHDPFAGAAQSLVQQGIPAVVAMQFEISDQAAITFSQEFYSAVADSYPVDAALAEARKAIFAQGNKLEWGTPVLYMRAPDGQIFDMAQAIPASLPDATKAPRLPAPSSSPDSAIPSPALPILRRGRALALWSAGLAVILILLAIGFYRFRPADNMTGFDPAIPTMATLTPAAATIQATATPLPSTGTASTVTVYGDSLASGWQDWPGTQRSTWPRRQKSTAAPKPLLSPSAAIKPVSRRVRRLTSARQVTMP